MISLLEKKWARLETDMKDLLLGAGYRFEQMGPLIKYLEQDMLSAESIGRPIRCLSADFKEIEGEG